ncbi:MAG: hypothetical protein EBW53_05925 [Actinobacteria bacterium]|nr:hypothetical protein [Actinomycetota bacterium]
MRHSGHGVCRRSRQRCRVAHCARAPRCTLQAWRPRDGHRLGRRVRRIPHHPRCSSDAHAARHVAHRCGGDPRSVHHRVGCPRLARRSHTRRHGTRACRCIGRGHRSHSDLSRDGCTDHRDVFGCARWGRQNAGPDYTKGRGVDVVLDVIGGDYTVRNVACLAQKGRIIQVGTMAGPSKDFNVASLMPKRASITGTVLRPRPKEEKIAVSQAFAEALLPDFDAGVLKPVIDKRFTIDQIVAAHEHMEANANIGKIVVTIAA